MIISINHNLFTVLQTTQPDLVENLACKKIALTRVLLDGNIKNLLRSIPRKKVNCVLILSIMCLKFLPSPESSTLIAMSISEHINQLYSEIISDHKIGFGGKFGIQKDRVDKSAVGYEHHEHIEKHESQKGMTKVI